METNNKAHKEERHEPIVLPTEEQENFGNWLLSKFSPAHSNKKLGHGALAMPALTDEATVVCKCGYSVTIRYEQYVALQRNAA